jgi:hypothetical protein
MTDERLNHCPTMASYTEPCYSWLLTEMTREDSKAKISDGTFVRKPSALFSKKNKNAAIQGDPA